MILAFRFRSPRTLGDLARRASGLPSVGWLVHETVHGTVDGGLRDMALDEGLR